MSIAGNIKISQDFYFGFGKQGLENKIWKTALKIINFNFKLLRCGGALTGGLSWIIENKCCKF